MTLGESADSLILIWFACGTLAQPEILLLIRGHCLTC